MLLHSIAYSSTTLQQANLSLMSHRSLLLLLLLLHIHRHAATMMVVTSLRQ
jgi:hypothetical protein